MKPSPRNKNQSSVHQDKEDNHLLVIKGSPGSVFAEVKRMRILLGWV